MASQYAALLFLFFFSSSGLEQVTCHVSLPTFPFINGIINNTDDYIDKNLLCQSVNETEAEALLGALELYLCNGAHPDECQIAALSEANSLLTGAQWHSAKESVLFLPGWTNSATSEGYSTEVIDAYARNGSYNLLILNWYSVNNLSYLKTVSLMPFVYERVAAKLDNLSAGFSKLRLVGHSLGAQLAGGIARKLKTLVPQTIAALDPAGPLFYKSTWKCQDPVSAADADFVVAMHSDSGKYGGSELVGGVDLMPNGGDFPQPGCNAKDEDPAHGNKGMCSHVRALLLWCDAVRRPGSLLARACPSQSAFAAGECAHNPAFDITDATANNGTYYFTTNEEVPYGKGRAGI